ncbi:homeobox-leucine zipper protein ATHB-8-like isoform X2 [Argentina anserina]|uniref:homeobox-leucine zipper protein ATHB-8-like isoform X2 n=1 Tax=Argentina anserina TaxID=57926 RepID=UPI0021763BB5|nr:homeobox-leucine zipper protein ATHB-8-like isoform X2 [Potentilla anserina]
MNKLLMEENDRLQKQVSHLVYENNYFLQQTQNTTLATTDTSCESVVTSGQHHSASTKGWEFIHCRGDFSIVSFTGYWNCCGVGPIAWYEAWSPDPIGIVAISHGCTVRAAWWVLNLHGNF